LQLSKHHLAILSSPAQAPTEAQDNPPVVGRPVTGVDADVGEEVGNVTGVASVAGVGDDGVASVTGVGDEELPSPSHEHLSAGQYGGT